MPSPPASEAALIARAEHIAGLTLGELAQQCASPLPRDLEKHNGVVGDLLAVALGATAKSTPVPDFEHLGIELKTIPLNEKLKPRESTHVCSVTLSELGAQRWADSTVRHKLARVLWIPIEAQTSIALTARRIGRACLWSPSAAEETILRRDWEEHMELLVTGQIEQLDARMGTYLQVRPKAANRDALAATSDSSGAPSATLPRGFYLRPRLTARILSGADSL